MRKNIEWVPPDGGWGILVCIGMALAFICGLSALPSFGLIFGDFLKEIGAETSAIAFVTSFFFCSLSFAGLFSGSLFNRFGIRKIGLLGGFLYFTGSVIQIFVNSIWSLTLAFSVLQGAGFGLIIPTSYTTFNNYFVKKRVVWMSFAQSLIGLGSMIYPILIQKLLDWFGFRGCLIVLAGINAHAILGMALMQPVEWHMNCVQIIDPEELLERNNPTTQTMSKTIVPEISISRKETFVNGDTINADEIEKEAQHHLTPLMHDSQRLSKEDLQMLSRRASSITSLGNWTGPVVVSDASPEMTIRSRAHSTAASSVKNDGPVATVTMEQANDIEPQRNCWQKLVDFLDLTLMKDLIYVNIVLGMSFALYSDVAFFTLQPLYLFELGFNKADTAAIIAIGAAADLGSRIFLAFSAIFIQIPSRYIYLAGAFFTIIARFAFIYIFDFIGMACITASLGFLRTWIHVTLPLVVAEYLPKERFATGYGLFMFIQGNILFLVGPIVGYLRDLTKDYIFVFHLLNFFMGLCAVPWIIEIVCTKFRRKQEILTYL